jgi:hypothetical protein
MTRKGILIGLVAVASLLCGCVSKRFTSCLQDGDAYILTSVVMSSANGGEIEGQGQVWRGTYDPSANTMTCQELGANR